MFIFKTQNSKFGGCIEYSCQSISVGTIFHSTKKIRCKNKYTRSTVFIGDNFSSASFWLGLRVKHCNMNMTTHYKVVWLVGLLILRRINTFRVIERQIKSF